jgi:hypothetical protein
MRVQCITDFESARGAYTTEILPIKGEIYNIRGIIKREEATGYHLEEIVNTFRWYRDRRNASFFCEVSFDVRDFRPITDISSLVRLTKVRKLEDA